MSSINKIKSLVTTHTVGRKDSKRSTRRKQLFYERQLNAMRRWDQVAVVAWK
jgi:hypothetical protein